MLLTVPLGGAWSSMSCVWSRIKNMDQMAMPTTPSTATIRMNHRDPLPSALERGAMVQRELWAEVGATTGLG